MPEVDAKKALEVANALKVYLTCLTCKYLRAVVEASYLCFRDLSFFQRLSSRPSHSGSILGGPLYST